MLNVVIQLYIIRTGIEKERCYDPRGVKSQAPGPVINKTRHRLKAQPRYLPTCLRWDMAGILWNKSRVLSCAHKEYQYYYSSDMRLEIFSHRIKSDMSFY